MKTRKILLSLLCLGAIFGVVACEKPVVPTEPTKQETPTPAPTTPIDATYTVTFNLNGGTGTAEPQTVKHGEKVTLPTGITKEGCKLKAWYKDSALTIPFVPSATITSDLTLYAKWESLVRFSGTNAGNATYNSEDGTYTFTTELGLYGRFTVAYDGQLLSADPEGDLIITGAFTSENQAGWDENLYCDIPDGAEPGTPIDYTTFICSSSRTVIYTVTYDPASNTLDIAAEFGPDEFEVSETGLYYVIRDNNRLVSSYGDATKNADGSYSLDYELSRWWRIYLYFDGKEIDVTGEAADIKGDFGTWSGRDNPMHLYSDLENDGPNAFISSYEGVVKHKVTYVPATDSAKAYVIFDADPENEPYDPSQEGVVKTNFSVDLAQDTALAVWTEKDLVLRDSAAGSWGPLANGWRLVCIVDADGKIVYFALNIANGFGSVGEDGPTYYAHPDYATNNPAYKATDAGWTVSIPEGCIAITGHSDKALALILALTGVEYEDSNAAQVVVNNMHAIAETARVVYDVTAGTVDVTGGGVGEQPEEQPKELTPTKTNEDAGGDAFALWTTAGHKFHTPSGWANGGWRLFVVVDAEGRIAYLVLNAPNGYGGPSGTGYYVNGHYTDYTTNPAIEILEGFGPWVKDDPNKASEQFNIVIPEGGFGISAHGTSVKTLLASFANNADVAVGDADLNKRGILEDTLRLKVVDGKLVISEASAEEPTPEPTPEPEINPNVPAQGLGYENSYGAQGTDIHYGTAEDVIDNGDGTYSIIVELAAWRYVKLYWNGILLDTASTLTLESKGNIYIGDAPDPSDRLYTNAAGKFEFVFTPATETEKAKVVAGPYVEEVPTPSIPSEGYTGTMVVGGTFPQEIEAVNGVYTLEATFATWNRFSLKIGETELTTSNANITGLFLNDANAPWDNRFYTEDGKTFLYSKASPTTYVITYTTATNTLNIAEKVVEEEAPSSSWLVSSDQHAVVYTEAGTEIYNGSSWVGNGWRVYIAVDAKGRIAYLCEFPPNGYGNPNETSYARHSVYADKTKNPALVIADSSWKLVVPEGGYVVVAHATDAVIKALFGSYTQHAVNNNSYNVDEMSLVYDAEAGTVSVGEAVEEEASSVDPVYYYFNDGTPVEGTTSYVFEGHYEGSTATGDFNGLAMDATTGKIASRGSDTQINAGAKITFEVEAGATVTITNHSGYHNYTLNGVAADSDAFSQTYAEVTTVEFVATDTVYLWTLFVTYE